MQSCRKSGRNGMTIDERIERLEFVTAAHIEQAKKDYEENRRIWREHQTEVGAIWQAMERRSEETDRLFRQLRTEEAERGRQVDERIEGLVSAMGEFIQRLDKK